jgi:hypothetical protein
LGFTALGFSSGHRFGGQNLEQLLGVQVAPMGMLIFWLVFNVAMAALFGRRQCTAA